MQLPTSARHILAIATLAIVITAAACGSDDSTGPSMQDVAGSYDATVLTVQIPGTTFDMIDSGASVHLVLTEGGDASGHIFAPATDFSEELDTDLGGTWTLDGGTVTLTQPEDTFLRDITLEASGGRLTGSGSFDGAIVHVVLERD